MKAGKIYVQKTNHFSFVFVRLSTTWRSAPFSVTLFCRPTTCSGWFTRTSASWNPFCPDASGGPAAPSRSSGRSSPERSSDRKSGWTCTTTGKREQCSQISSWSFLMYLNKHKNYLDWVIIIFKFFLSFLEKLEILSFWWICWLNSLVLLTLSGSWLFSTNTSNGFGGRGTWRWSSKEPQPMTLLHRRQQKKRKKKKERKEKMTKTKKKINPTSFRATVLQVCGSFGTTQTLLNTPIKKFRDHSSSIQLKSGDINNDNFGFYKLKLFSHNLINKFVNVKCVEDMLGQKLCRVNGKSISDRLDCNIEIIKIEIDSWQKSLYFQWS